MISAESEFYINKVMNIWYQVGIWKLMAVETFMAMLGCILTDIYFGMFWLGVIFGVASLIFAVIGISFGYFGIDNFVNKYMYNKISEEESEFIKRCESRNPYGTPNIVKYEHLLVG
jgi:hypothetical protein